MMVDIWQQLQSFMGRGGPVLWVILALLVLMWILMIERLLYLNLGFGLVVVTHRETQGPFLGVRVQSVRDAGLVPVSKLNTCHARLAAL